VPNVLKSGSFNPQEPSESVQACTRIALLLPFTFAPAGLKMHACTHTHAQIKNLFTLSGKAEQMIM
jgi:hypothetical protein